MESKGSFFILIIVVAVLTLTLAALAGYLFLVQGTPNNKAAATGEVVKKEALKEEETLRMPLYDSKTYFNLKSDDPKKISVIQVNVYLKCINQLKSNKKLKVNEMLEAYKPEIQEKVLRFFMNITLDDVKNTDTFDKAKDALKKQINELLSEGQEKPEDIVYDVIFNEWLFQ